MTPQHPDPNFEKYLAEERALLEPIFSHSTLRLMNPPVRSVLVCAGGCVRIESPQPFPNVWVRFWYRALLGWRWERV